jgi:hypothetical protein
MIKHSLKTDNNQLILTVIFVSKNLNIKLLLLAIIVSVQDVFLIMFKAKEEIQSIAQLAENKFVFF